MTCAETIFKQSYKVNLTAGGGQRQKIQIVDMDIDEGLAMMKTLNQEEFQVMKIMTGQ